MKLERKQKQPMVMEIRIVVSFEGLYMLFGLSFERACWSVGNVDYMDMCTCVCVCVVYIEYAYMFYICNVLSTWIYM